MNKWKVDSSASRIDFSVAHMMVSNVTGSFNEFSGELAGNIADLTKSSIHFQIAVRSITTDNKERDAHLCSSDFFDAENFPVMTYTSRTIYPHRNGTYQMTGTLTIKDVQQNVRFIITPESVTVFGASYRAEGIINRKDFGLTWNRAIEAGGVMVGDKISIRLLAAVVRAESPAE